jgi:glycosyltransferase involved in cell wall biosynthesis
MTGSNVTSQAATSQTANADLSAALPADPAGWPCLRVLHLNAGNLYGGVETMLRAVASSRQLCPGMEPHFGMCYEGRSSREIRASGAPVHLLGPARISRPWTVWRARRRLRELLRQERFDAVVCHMAWSLAVFGSTVRAAGCPLVLWEHGVSQERNWLERVANWTGADLAIANSRFTAGAMRSYFQNVPVRVLYCPVARADAPDFAGWRAAVRAEERVGCDTAVIIQVGRLEWWKGHFLHLQALAQLNDLDHWVCWIVGGPQRAEEDEYFRRLQETARELGVADRVRFLGQRSDVPELLAAADIFCQPNQAPEPFGLVFIEALYAGRPIVTTTLGGPMEIVDESCGLLAEPENPAALAAALRRLVQSPELRERLGQGGPRRASELCDPATQLKELRQLLFELAKRSRPA